MEDRFKPFYINDIPIIEVTTLGAYVTYVEDLAVFWRNHVQQYTKAKKTETFPGELVPWFRGNSKKFYELDPALLRTENKNNQINSNYFDILKIDEEDENATIEGIKGIEEYMIRRFSTSGLPHVSLHDPLKIHWHMLMQHNGLPTRLLDWSKSAMIALYFAIRKCSDRKISRDTSIDAAVWALDPRRLQEECEGTRRIYTEIDKDKKDIIESYINLDEDCAKKYPLPIIPAHVHDRISAQQARFTFHSHKRGKLFEFGKKLAASTRYPPLVKFVIPFEYQETILRALRLMGVSDQEITPSLDSISREIQQRISLGRTDLVEK